MRFVHVDRHGQVSQCNSRIPSTLQNVILASNRGIEVNAPPPRREASKIFFRGRLGRTFSKDLDEMIPTKYGGYSKQSSLVGQFLTPMMKRRKSNDTTAETVDSVLDDLTNKASSHSINPSSSHSVNPASSHSINPEERKKKKKKVPSTTTSLNPQTYLNAMISARGYATQSYETKKSAYYSKPSELQLASYGTYMIALVREGYEAGLQAALASGLSSNPCNAYGESLLHNVCRRGDDKLLAVMMNAGCDIQVCDDKGRTPLHDACWAPRPAFRLVEMLLERDISLLYMADERGALPLSYVRQDQWSKWLQFLESKKDVFWPRRGKDPMPPPPLTLQSPNTKVVATPEAPLTLELAQMVATGKVTPDEALYLLNNDEDSDEDISDSCSDDDDASDSDECSESSSNDDLFNDDEMQQILKNLETRGAQPLAW